MKYSFVLWDFDGTLADSLAVSLAIFNRLARLLDFKPVDDLQAVRSMSVRTFLKVHGISMFRLPQITKEFHQAQRREISKVRLYPGMTQVIKEMHAAGIRQGILSSNSAENIQLCLQAHGVGDYFEFTAGCFKLLGKARGVRRVVKQNGLAKCEMLYVGDEIRDVFAARKAGIDVAAVGWGINDWRTLQRAGPTHQVATPLDLLAVAGIGTGPLPLSRNFSTY